MKNYSERTTPAKRYIQDKVFSSITNLSNQSLTALAGSSPITALEMYQKYFSKKITLVDLFPKDPCVTQSYIEYMPATPIMDVDLEQSIINSQYTIMNVLYNMQTQLTGYRALCFTVSLRCKGGQAKTFDILNNILFNNTLIITDSIQESINVNSKNIWKICHKQSIFKTSQMYRYKDSSHMLSGIVTWDK